MRKIIIITVIAVVVIIAAVIYSKALKAVPQNGQSAVMTKFENLRDLRYAEIFLIGGNGIIKNLSAAFYNTTALNDEADASNTCPQELWDKIDVDLLKKKYNDWPPLKMAPVIG